MPVSLEGIELPEDIEWVDEFRGFGVGQTIEPTITGSLVVEENEQVDGRPISLQTGPKVWVHRQTIVALEALAATPLADNETLTLIWGDGRTFEVVFDRSRGQPLEAQPIRRLAAGAQLPTHPYSLSLSLILKDAP